MSGRVLGSAIQNFILRRRLPWLGNLKGLADWGRVATLLGPASAVMAVPAAQVLLLQGSAVTLGIAAGASVVPIFTASRTLSRIGLQGTQLITTAVMPEFSAAAARNESFVKAKLLVFLVVLCTLLAAPFCIVLAMWGPEVVVAWTRGLIQPPAAMLAIMALSILMGGLWMPISSMLVALNQQASFSYYYLILSICSIPVSLWLARSRGPTGTALALLAVDIAMLALILLNVSRIGASVGDARAGFHFLRTSVVGALRSRLRI